MTAVERRIIRGEEVVRKSSRAALDDRVGDPVPHNSTLRRSERKEYHYLFDESALLIHKGDG
jgi:hypothetical protein